MTGHGVGRGGVCWVAFAFERQWGLPASRSLCGGGREASRTTICRFSGSVEAGILCSRVTGPNSDWDGQFVTGAAEWTC